MSEEETMASALRILAQEIQSPDDIPAMCLRDAAAMIERLTQENAELKSDQA